MSKITEDEYKKACKEAYIIITEYLQEDIARKIPEEKILFYRDNMNEAYEFIYDEEKDLEEQILYATKCILANLFRDYIANEEDKKAILEKEFKELEAIEEEKRKRYNPDNIFNKVNDTKSDSNIKNTDETVDNKMDSNLSLTVKKDEQSVFSKIINFFKSLFKTKK